MKHNLTEMMNDINWYNEKRKPIYWYSLKHQNNQSYPTSKREPPGHPTVNFGLEFFDKLMPVTYLVTIRL